LRRKRVCYGDAVIPAAVLRVTLSARAVDIDHACAMPIDEQPTADDRDAGNAAAPVARMGKVEYSSNID